MLGTIICPSNVKQKHWPAILKLEKSSKKPQMASVAKSALKKGNKSEDGARFVPSSAAARSKMQVFCTIQGSTEFANEDYRKFIGNTPVQGVIRWIKDVKLAHAVLISLFSVKE